MGLHSTSRPNRARLKPPKPISFTSCTPKNLSLGWFFGGAMSEIKPFRGLCYSQKAGDPNLLFSPPYDVISDQQRETLYKDSKLNISRVIKSKEAESESDSEKYCHASKIWSQWEAEGFTVRDNEPCYYFYEQEFQYKGEKYNRLGLVVAYKLVELGSGVHAHEKTLAGPKVDRLHLLSQTKTHFGQIFSFLESTLKSTSRQNFFLKFTDIL